MRLIVDPIACEAHGHCAELLPEAITLDEWGYPMIAGDQLPASLEPLARRAVSTCPTLALRLQGSEAARRSVMEPVEPVLRRPRGELSQQRQRKHQA